MTFDELPAGAIFYQRADHSLGLFQKRAPQDWTTSGPVGYKALSGCQQCGYEKEWNADNIGWAEGDFPTEAERRERMANYYPFHVHFCRTNPVWIRE